MPSGPMTMAAGDHGAWQVGCITSPRSPSGVWGCHSCRGFGQLPPAARSMSLPLLHTEVHGNTREQTAANHVLRLLIELHTIVCLRLIHGQPGDSPYNVSLSRTRAGAQTSEDHALWPRHTWNGIDTCISHW